jgi:copper chaperone CopZ
MKNITFNVKGMHCASCGMLITDSLEETGAVKSVKADHISGKVTVEFDEKKIDDKKIKSLISKEGFKVD